MYVCAQTIQNNNKSISRFGINIHGFDIILDRLHVASEIEQGVYVEDNGRLARMMTPQNGDAVMTQFRLQYGELVSCRSGSVRVSGVKRELSMLSHEDLV